VEGGAAPSRPTSNLAQQAADAQRRGDFAHARTLYEQAIARGDVSAELYNNYASLQRATGSLAGAVASYRAAIALDSRNAVAWSNLGVVFDGLGQRGDATASFQQALRLDPHNATTKLNLALQFRAVGALDEARRMLDEVVLSAPDLAEGHYARGQVLEDQGDRAAAVREYSLFLRAAGTRLPAASEQVRRHIVQLGGTP
jgi:tetratricopeptide (TPR) repeat protein